MIGLGFVYAVAGATFAAFAWLSFRDRSNSRRIGTGSFYGLLAVSFFGGDRIGVIISHRLASLRGVDRVVVLEAGRVVEEGRPEELLRAGGAFARLWELQAAKAA